MPHYLIQASYTSESWSTQLANPQDPTDRLRPAVEGLRGSIKSVFYAFGDYDVIAIVEFPDNESVSAFSQAASAGGAVRSVKTTPLMTIDQGIAAMKLANESMYRPPSA